MIDSNGAERRGLSRQRWRSRVLWGTALLLAVRMVVVVAGRAEDPAHGFVAHYTASRLLLEGDDVARFYDSEWFANQVARFEPSVFDIYHANLPTTALLTLPVAPLPYRTARLLWTLLSVVLLILSVFFLLRGLGLRDVRAAVFYCFAFLYQPVYENLYHAQMYILMLVVLLVAWQGFRRREARILGSAVGVLFVSKTAGLLLWPMMLVQRRWKALLWGLSVILGVGVVSLPLVGWTSWQIYLGAATDLAGNAGLSVTAYQTVLSLLRRLFVPDERWNPSPLLEMPVVGLVLPFVVGAAMLAWTAWVAMKRKDDCIFAGFVLLGLMLTPVSLDYHYTLALLPIAVLLAGLGNRVISPVGLAFIGGALLIAADLPYRAPAIANGWLAFLGYPKLYGACILWVLTLSRAWREEGG